MLTRKPQAGDVYGTPATPIRVRIVRVDENTNRIEDRSRFIIEARSRLNSPILWTMQEFITWLNEVTPMPTLRDQQGNPINVD